MYFKEAENLKSSSNYEEDNNNVLVAFSNDGGFNSRSATPQQTQIQKQTNEYEQVKERKQQFNQLETDIQDLNSMFKDLAVMVHDQGQDIGLSPSMNINNISTFLFRFKFLKDAIEKNISNSEFAVQGATGQLQEAIKYQVKKFLMNFRLVYLKSL
jgi:hypothetical protein